MMRNQYAIYMATVDYMIASYGPWSASATGGNGFARDFLAGIAAMYSVPSNYAPIPCKRYYTHKEHSVRAHGHDKSFRMALDFLRLHGNHPHYPYLCVLLEGAEDSRIVTIRTDGSSRQKGGWPQGFSMWLWGPRSCRAISIAFLS